MRISNFSVKKNLIDNVQKNYSKMEKKQIQMATGRKNLRVSDSPIETINSIYNRTRLNHIKQYEKNILDSKDYINLSHDKMLHGVDVMQRIRELAVQGSNGIYSPSDREKMGIEVEELLREMIHASNTKFDDSYLYSGTSDQTKPFVFTERTVTKVGLSVVDKVEYLGDYRQSIREIGKEERVSVGLPGNEVFWAEQHVIVGLSDAQNYIAERDQTIRIDGKEVSISQGDNLDTIIASINRNVSSVTAFKRPLENGNVVFSIESNYPHQIALEDIYGGNVLQNLGIIREGENSQFPGRNINPNTIESTGSIFDAIIQLRDSLIYNRPQEISGKNLNSISEGLNNLLRNQSKISALQERLNSLEKSYGLEKVQVTERLSKNEDMDIAEASMQLNQLQNVHRISLMTASKYIQPTLMDYL